MLRPITPTKRRRDRRGVILLVVLALLTLFTIIGISFVYYSDSEAQSSRIYRESHSQRDRTAPEPHDAINRALASLIFPVGDTGGDLLNALRGHDLTRTLYGWNGTPGQNNTPYGGIGTFHGTTIVGDRVYMVNYTLAGNIVYDAEWDTVRTAGSAMPPTPNLLNTPPQSVPNNTFIPKNAPYTYPDANNFFLGSLSTQTGEVVLQSFYRPWIFRDATQAVTATGLEPTNPNWTNALGRYKILRPRPVDQLTQAEIGGRTGAALDTYIAQQIAAGTIMPYPPSCLDASGNYVYRGDVSNLGGGYSYGTSATGTPIFAAQNDSLWMDIGLPPKLWNGKMIKPLVAMLVVDLDGRLNLNAHHNLDGNYQGWGPWEVSLRHVLDPTGMNGEATNVVTARHGTPGPGGVPTARGTNTRVMAPDPNSLFGFHQPLPAYGLVRWDGSGTGTIRTPGYAMGDAPPFSTSPFFDINAGFDDNRTTSPQLLNWPGLYNPNEWQSFAVTNQSRTFPLNDLRRLSFRYADKLANYQTMDVATYTPTSLVGQTPTGNNYRLDGSHPNRFAVTTLSAGLDRPGLTANFINDLAQPNAALQFVYHPDPLVRRDGSTLFPTAGLRSGSFGATAPNPGSIPLTSADFGQFNWNHLRAAIGPINVNRPLTGYYQPGSAPNPAAPQNGMAWPDRQFLARDIFARFVLATGAQATIVTTTTTVGTAVYQPGDVIPTAVPGTPEYNALRYLAQLAANIVDYIDDDDISTPFVWNPVPPPTPGRVNPFDLPNFAPGELQNRVVFGTELPRLLVNEVYSEVTNAPAETTTGAMGAGPTNDMHVRFWVELLNPRNTPYNTPTMGAQGDGRAQLRYDMMADGVPTSFNPYRIEVYSTGAAAVSNLQTPENVTGDPMIGPNTVTPRIRYNFLGQAGAPRWVMPNNGAYAPASPPGTPPNGIAIVGPSIPAPPMGGATGPQPFEFNPAPVGGMMVPTAPWDNMIQADSTGADRMHYQVQVAGFDYMRGRGAEFRRNLIVLQRLANPYRPPGPLNPYITVDYKDWVPTFDAIGRLDTQAMPRMPYDMATQPQGYDQVPSRFAIGKVQPYAGFTAQPTLPNMGQNFPTYPFENPTLTGSYVLPQLPAPPNAAQPQHTFGRHNGTTVTPPTGATTPTAGATATGELLSPYDWLIHFDRPVISPLELLQVRGGRAADLTQDFLYWDGVNNTRRRDLGLAPWVSSGNTPVNGLYRALDLLRVNWGYMNAVGGRIHGRINLNTVQDQRVLRALVNDPNNNTYADLLWAGDTAAMPPVPGYIVGSRTRTSATKTQPDTTTAWTVPVPGKTVDDTEPADLANINNYDRPFKPFGIASFAAPAGPMPTGTYALGGSGVQDTILRLNGNVPYLAMPGQIDPYMQSEGARKIINSTTTVSNVFAVWVTVGYFEVRMDATGNPMTVDEGGGNLRYLLGKEAYREVPGDIRHQIFATIDRTQIGLVPSLNPAVPPTTFQTSQPFTTSLEAAAPVNSSMVTIAGIASGPNGFVYSDGVAVPVVNTQVVIGVGATAEVRTITALDLAMPAPPPGTIRVVLSAPLTNAQGAGVAVSNVVHGNPGPQANFDTPLTNPNSNYRFVVPYITRIR